jgi:hypothetical protein
MMHDLHKYSVLHGNLKFSCLLTIKVYPPSHFQLFFIVASVEIICKPFYYFSFRSTASRFIETTDVGRVLPLKSRVSSTHHLHPCVWVYSTLFFYPSWRIQLFCGWMKHFWMDAWPYFPGLKVGQIYLYTSFFIIDWR